jgi:acylaminoacyl-peptidase
MSRPTCLRTVCDAYREAARCPALLSARIEAVGGVLALTSRWSQTNLGSQQKLTFAKTHLVTESSLEQQAETPPVPESGRELATTRGDVTAVVRAGKGAEDGQTVEVWRAGGLQSSFNMKEVDAHGRIYTDSEFGCLELSEDLTSLLYVAERKRPKVVPFLGQGEVPAGAEVGTEAVYREEWGEQLVGRHQSVLVKLDLTAEQPARALVLEGAPEGWCPGLARWWRGGVVGVAYRTTPRRLGKVYCSNRPGQLFHLAEGRWRVLAGAQGQELGLVRVEVSPAGELVWLERSLQVEDGPFPGPHQAALRLMALAGPDDRARQVVGELHPAFTGADPAQFCGLFAPSIAPRPWLADSLLVLSCAQGETTLPVVVDLAKGAVAVAADPSARGVTVLDCRAGLVLGARSDPLTPPHLVLARWTEGAVLEFKPLAAPAPRPGVWRGFTISPPPCPPLHLPYTAHYIGPEAGEPASTPLIGGRPSPTPPQSGPTAAPTQWSPRNTRPLSTSSQGEVTR